MLATETIDDRLIGMSTPRHPDTEAAIIHEAFTVVQARLDVGDDFERRCGASPTFANAIEVARLWRAFQPGRLFLSVVQGTTRSNERGRSDG